MTRSNVRVFLLMVAGLAGLLAVTLVAAQSSSTATVEVRVWRNVADPERLHLSTRPSEGRWVTHETPLDMSELSRSGNWHQSSIIAVDVEVPVAEAVAGPPVPSWFHVIDGSAGCAALVAYFAEHFPADISVMGCEAFDVREDRIGLRGVLDQGGSHASFRAVWTDAGRLRSVSWTPMLGFPYMSPICFDTVRRFLATGVTLKSWDCNARGYVEQLTGDEGEPYLAWDVIAAVSGASGGQWGVVATFAVGESEPENFSVRGARPSRFHGIDDTPECAALVAYLAEHFAETTSAISCEGKAFGDGSLQGLLVHSGEAAYFDGRSSEDGGITRLNWTPTVTWPATPARCTMVTDWLVERYEPDLPGTCFAQAFLRFDPDPYIEWLVVGILFDNDGGTGEWTFRAGMVESGANSWWRFKLTDIADDWTVAGE